MTFVSRFSRFSFACSYFSSPSSSPSISISSSTRRFVFLRPPTTTAARARQARHIITMSHSYTTKAPGAESVIRPSASVCLLNSKNQVLLVQRTASASSFANTHVFPGGNMDAQDNASYEMCAIRELFEEAGVLLTTTPPSLTSEQLDEARKGIHSGKLNFSQWLQSNNLQADVSRLKKFTTWITPPTMKKRYNTQMFLAFSSSSESSKEETSLPKHDGGIEIISTSYHSPSSALNSLHEGKIIMFPPQAYLLTRLSDYITSTSTPEDVEAQREKISEWLSGSEGVGSYVFTPRPEGRTTDGRVVLSYGPKGDQNRRSLLTVGKNGMPKDIHIVTKEEAVKLMAEGAKL